MNEMKINLPLYLQIKNEDIASVNVKDQNGNIVGQLINLAQKGEYLEGTIKLNKDVNLEDLFKFSYGQ